MMNTRHLNASSKTIVTSTSPSPSAASVPSPVLTDDEQARLDFYRTYDVMTGVRIAATLGGFFMLMVILVVYKSKSKTERALEDPNIVAAVKAEAEEEERQITAALEATAYQVLNPRKSRRSLDTCSSSVSPAWIRNTTRFSSIGGYSSLLEPPIANPLSKIPCSIDEDSPPEERSLYEDLSTFYNRYLDVPRRESNITCSSSGSSYLERRGSSVILGLPAAPTQNRNRGRRRQSSSSSYLRDFYYPINIRVIQPTPGGSPCGSERTLYGDERNESATTAATAVTAAATTVATKNINAHQRLAPLASISSCNSSLGPADYPDLMDGHSFASDSVFRDEEYDDDDDDTDDEIDPFSTDTDTEGPSETDEGSASGLQGVAIAAVGKTGTGSRINSAFNASEQSLSLLSEMNIDKNRTVTSSPIPVRVSPNTSRRLPPTVLTSSMLDDLERRERSQETLF